MPAKPMLPAQTCNVIVRSLHRNDWPVIETLFGAKGACGGCWCMYWRVQKGGRTWDAVRGEPARQGFQELVESGRVNGLLAFAGEEPIGWACIGPYGEFPRLATVRALARSRPAGTWSVTCFYISSRWRKRGVGTKLLRACIKLAEANGAKVLEGYPVPVKSASALPGAFAWTGVPAMFAKANFCALGSSHAGRQVWVHKLSRKSSRLSASHPRSK